MLCVGRGCSSGWGCVLIAVSWCVQGVVWGGAAMGWLCPDHTTGAAEEV